MFSIACIQLCSRVQCQNRIAFVEDDQRDLVAARHAFVSAARGLCALARKQPATAARAAPSSLVLAKSQ